MSRFVAAGPSHPNHKPTHDFDPFASYGKQPPVISETSKRVYKPPHLATHPNWKPLIDLCNPSAQFAEAHNQLVSLFAKQPTQSIETSCNTQTSQEAQLDVIEIRVGHKHFSPLKENKQNLVFDIEIHDNPMENSSVHVPSELCIVMDISGSMSGEPLAQSKLAICNLIDKLHEEDLLHLVTYGSEAKAVFQKFMNEDGRQIAKSLVNEINTAGCTNLSLGLLAAMGSLSTSPYSKSKSTNRRLFIFSDGQVNEGVEDQIELTSLIRLIQSNFLVNSTTFGFGDSFNEDLMKEIASEGKGDFFFIDGVEDLDFKVSKGLQVLQSLYAVNTNLNIMAVNPDQCTITQVHGYSHIESSVGQASLGDLCFDDLRQVLCTVTINPPSGVSEGDSMELLRYSLSYSELHPDGVNQCQKQGSISIQFTNDQDLLDEQPDALKVAQTIQLVNETEKKILKCVERSNFDEAIKLKKFSIKLLQQVLPIDTTDVVRHLISRGESTLSKLENKPSDASLAKDIGYSAYRGGIVHRKCF